MFSSTPFWFTVKTEVKLEERINGLEIKGENIESSNTRLKYPNNLGEFLDRNTPQLFLMQVNIYKFDIEHSSKIKRCSLMMLFF